MAKYFLEGQITSLSKGNLQFLYLARDFKETGDFLVKWDVRLKDRKDLRQALYDHIRGGYEKDDFITLTYTHQNGQVVYGPFECFAYGDTSSMADVFTRLKNQENAKALPSSKDVPQLF